MGDEVYEWQQLLKMLLFKNFKNRFCRFSRITARDVETLFGPLDLRLGGD